MAVTVNKARHGSAQGALIRLAPVAAALAMGFSAPAQAVDWRLTPSVGASATFSDNAKQSSTNPEDAMILSVTPGFSLRSVGSRRVQASLQYGLIATSRFGDSESNDLNHNLSAVGKAELVEDFIFIDGSARISQELVSLTGSLAESDVNNSNRAEVGTYSISPYIVKRFGSFASSRVRYTASGAIFENDAVAQSSSNAISAELNSGPRFNDVSWGLNYSLRKTQNDKTTDTTFERIGAQLGYQLTRKFRVSGTVGEDRNDYQSTSQTGGSYYTVGFGWAPTRRTSLEASAGERYFGKVFNVSATHRTRHTQWNVRYFEDVIDDTQRLLDQSNSLYFVCDSFPFYRAATDLADTPPAGCSPPEPAAQLLSNAQKYFSSQQLVDLGFPTSLARGVYISKSLTAGVSWDIKRMNIGLSAQDTRRLYTLYGDAEDHVQGVTGSLGYRLSPKTSARSSLSLTRNSVDSLVSGGATREDDVLSLDVGLNHRFAEDVSGTLNLRHSQRDSNVATGDYTENRISATVNMRF